MIVTTDIGNILYRDCKAFGIDIVPDGETLTGELKSERIVIHTKKQQTGTYWKKSFDIDKVTADITPEIAKTLIQAAIKAKDEVLNVHGETWQIEETEASVTGYKNQLTGKNYRYDDVPGEVSPAFSIGQYDWKTKKAFMGGDVIQATSKDVGWKRALDKVIINKALFCLTDDDVWFIFPKCRIVSREANTDKAIAIAVKGLVQEPGIEGVSSEYNYEEGQIKALQA